MEVICQEDPAWDTKIRGDTNVKKYCRQCKGYYYPIDNMGAWKCFTPMYDKNSGRSIAIPADHGGPYSEVDDEQIPSYAKDYYNDTNPAAIINQEIVRPVVSSVITTYAMYTYRRYDYREWVTLREDYPLHGYSQEDPYNVR